MNSPTEIGTVIPSVINDRLFVMWEKQLLFNRRVGMDSMEALMKWRMSGLGPDRMPQEVAIVLGKLHVAMSQELAEFRDSIHWKWWKAGESNPQNAKVEVIDMFHFLMSMAQFLGMTADDFYQGYMDKNKINHKRQDGDYATNPNAAGGESDCKHLFEFRNQPELPLGT